MCSTSGHSQATPVSSLLVPPTLQDFGDCFVRVFHKNSVIHCKALSWVENSCWTDGILKFYTYYIHIILHTSLHIWYIYIICIYISFPGTKKSHIFPKIKAVSMVSNRNNIQTYKEVHQLPSYTTEPEATPKHQHNCLRRLPRSQLLLLENLPKPRIWVLLLLSKKIHPNK